MLRVAKLCSRSLLEVCITCTGQLASLAMVRPDRGPEDMLQVCIVGLWL
jgi:hypothetical protein